MSLHGWLIAKCTVCGTEIDWYINDMPFVDSMIIGTCSKCNKNMDTVKEFIATKHGIKERI